jgi:hypothetical protein
MSAATDFLNGWVSENVNATMYGETQTAEHLANDCLWEAKEHGIAEADLLEAAGGDLKAYMRAELNRVLDREVEDLVARYLS